MTTTIVPGPGTEITARRALARVSIDQPPGLFGRALAWVSRRMYGQALDNGFALAHNRKVLFATFGHERKVAKFDRVDPMLKRLAEMAAAAEIGCAWCIDFGYHLAQADGLDVAKLASVSDWRDAENLTTLEKQVIEFAIAATATPPQVTDELVAPLREALGEDGLVELTMMVAVENQRSRFNHALGLVSQGSRRPASYRLLDERRRDGQRRHGDLRRVPIAAVHHRVRAGRFGGRR